MSDLNEVVDTAKNVSKEVSAQAQDSGANLKENVQEIGGTLKDKAVELGSKAREATLSAQEQVVEYVKGNPLKALGAAFIGGWAWAKFNKRPH